VGLEVIEMEKIEEQELEETTELVKTAEVLINEIKRKRENYINDIENEIWDASNDLELSTRATDKIMKQLTDIPDVDEGDVLDVVMSENDYEIVNVKHLLEHFPDVVKDEEDAEDFFDGFFNWETHLNGAGGGIGIYYSRETGCYYAVSGDYFKNALSCSITKLNKKEMEDWLKKRILSR
jgi:hypothetical protein